ncbi:phage tail sheath C-terminal domain-containing protein [Flavonifractor plautii]|uniref:phage tail sheath C-terminal domain-containing protein n=1 Tax=Flavonifractor plautii TaxID=292800 RepID=UPI003D7C3DAD
MALGGGTFLTQNKILPGAYINFISVASASATLSDRGIATIPLDMNWGPEGEVITVELGDFQKNSQKIFGYAYTADELKPMREIFLHAKKVHFFRLNASGTKATCTYATAKYPGTRGNDLRIVIEANENSQPEALLYDVSTFLGTLQVDQQKAISQMSDLKNNDYVDFKTGASLGLTASTPLTSGANGTVEDATYQTYLDKMEAYTFNAMGCLSTNPTITALFASFCKRMRDDVGKKFQVVCFRNLADYEGVVSVKNGLVGDTENPALIPWATGVVAGTAVNKSATNMDYDGEYSVDTDYTQSELEAGITEGSFMFHLVDDNVVVLEDINTFTSITDEKSSDFSSNQTIRVLDQIANDIAVLFGTKYIGKVPNDASGRISLWNDIVKHHQELQNIRAIENFSPDNVTVAQGDTKKAVVVADYVTPVNAMAQLYMTVYVQ